VNNIQGPDWKIWEQPEEYKSRGLWALRAGEAAKLQGKETFDRFHLALLRARHEQKREIADPLVLTEVARESGLDAVRFQRELSDRSLLVKIGEEYTHGAQEHGIWGTPTLVLENGQAAYLKLRPAPTGEEAVKLFEELFNLIRNRPYVIELKRPK
jgi:predicted DsbA family dithiol-disulfide isomerase